MKGKVEIGEKGYIEGKYVTGEGRAHKCCRPHQDVFNCKMHGTFNVKLKLGRITEFQPSIITRKANYYFLQLKKGKCVHYGWAIRDHTSHQQESILEIITKDRIPNFFTKENFAVTILEKWNENQIRKWAKDQYWFQTFPFTPKPRADSEKLWKLINTISWSGMEVVDIGSHYGYFSFKAAEKGAQVIGVEPNTRSFKCASKIRDKIIQQDVKFIKIDTQKTFDVTLYLSVHHQIDPEYRKLEQKIATLKSRTRKYLFVELILPPMFPRNRKKVVTERMVDQMVKMQTICTYEHNVRGVRRVYKWTK